MEHTDMDCQQFEELAGAYVLGATSELERYAAQAHLTTCASCQHTVRELQAVTDLLPLAAPAVEPSPGLKKRVMAAVEANAREYAAAQQAAQRSQQRRWWQYPQTRLAAACVLILLVLSASLTAWNLNLQQQLSRVSEMFSYKIQGTSPDTTISGEAMYLPQFHVTILNIQGLPPLAGTEVYQGWVIKNNHPDSIGLLNVQDGVATLDFPGDIRAYDAVAVSREPGPQASQGKPHGPIVALGTLQNERGLMGAGSWLTMRIERKVEG
jgi:anti-sigma-K factor RskA